MCVRARPHVSALRAGEITQVRECVHADSVSSCVEAEGHMVLGPSILLLYVQPVITWCRLKRALQACKCPHVGITGVYSDPSRPTQPPSAPKN